MKERFGDRWNGPSGQQNVEAVLRALADGTPIDRLPLDRIDGRVDLRGFPFPKATADGARTIGRFLATSHSGGLVVKGVALDRIDLSHADLSTVAFLGGRLNDVSLAGAVLRGSKLLDLHLANVSFAGADLRDAALGRVHMTSVNLARSDLRGASVGDGEYFDCDLRGAKIDGVRFHVTHLERCRFGGRMRDVVFDGLGADPNRRGALVDVDFSEATFEFVDFNHLDLARVVPPSQKDLHVVRHYRCVLERWVARLEASSDPADARLRKYVANFIRGSLPGQDIGFFEERMLAVTPGGVAGGCA